MTPKAIVLDLDGTVLNTKKQISLRNRRAILDIKKSGINVIFATARPPRVTYFEGFEYLSRGVFMVYYNGAYYKCTNDMEDCHFGIPAKTAARVIDFIEGMDSTAVVAAEIKDNLYGYKDISYTSFDFVNKDHYPKIVDMEYLKTHELTKILIADFDFVKELAETFSEELNIITTDSGKLVQVMSSQVGKEIAVAAIAKNLRIDMNEVMCFGDDYNDLELFKAAGHSVAMGNAEEDLKKVATETTLTNDEDGVAVVLERILQNMY